MTPLEQRHWLRRLCVGEGENVRYPVAMKSRATGRIAFRVSRSGDGNTTQAAIELEDEDAVIDYVLNQGFGVRVSGPNHPIPSLLFPHRNAFRLV